MSAPEHAAAICCTGVIRNRESSFDAISKSQIFSICSKMKSVFILKVMSTLDDLDHFWGINIPLLIKCDFKK